MPIAKPLSPRLSTIARQIGLSLDVIEYCLEAGLVQQPLAPGDLAELRRIRRLQMLDVNIAGIEIILRMRRRMLAMQADLEAMAARMSDIQAHFESELRDMERRFAHDVYDEL